MYRLTVEEWKHIFKSSFNRPQFFSQNISVTIINLSVLQFCICFISLFNHPSSWPLYKSNLPENSFSDFVTRFLLSFCRKHLEIEFIFAFWKILKLDFTHCLIPLTCYQTQSKKESKQPWWVLIDSHNIITLCHHFHNVFDNCIKLYKWLWCILSTLFKIDSSNSTNCVTNCFDNFGCLRYARRLFQLVKNIRVLFNLFVCKHNLGLIESCYSNLLVY